VIWQCGIAMIPEL